MFKKSLFIALTIAALSGCTKLFLYSYGIRNPKIENEKSILEYLKENDLQTDNNFSLKDTSALYRFFDSKTGTPEIRFYDKNGYLMLYRDDKRCNAQNDSLISFLNPTNIIKIDSSQNIYSSLNELRTLSGEKLNSQEFQQYDFYLVTYWAKWAGKVNKTKIADWENSLKEKKDLRIKSIKVTTDYMDFWKVNKKDMFKIYSRKTKAKGEHKNKTP
jgi:hypothetical protein